MAPMPTQDYLAQRRAEVENALATGDVGAAIVVISQMSHEGYGQYGPALIEEIRDSHDDTDGM